MTKLLTAAQMRSLEQAAIANGEVTGLELMERAGKGVVQAVFAEWPELAQAPHRAVVLCGPGNNGGDGFVVARLLREWGWTVEVFFYGTAATLPPDARLNYERWREMGEVQTTIPGGDFDVIVDALFGIGLSRPLQDKLCEAADTLVKQAERGDGTSPAKIVAVDILSGYCADSGRQIGRPAFSFADLAVTFQRPKLGHYLCDAAAATRVLRCVDLGLAQPALAVSLTSASRDRLSKGADHKFSYGHALILSGDHGRSGAARLAARGALRIGAGLVTLASPPGAMAENAARLDAIMLREGTGGAELAEILQDKRINALCLGPGMGTGAREVGLLEVALAGRADARPMVLDADALTILSQHPDLFARLQDDCILTPHAGEFARLFPDIAEKLAAPATSGPAYSKVDATRDAAARAGCVVLYKGPDTVIADPSGRAAINAAVYDRAAPWLASAGSGDVLAGFIAGLLARGFSAFDAACTGAWLHVEAARRFGPGLIAEDLPEELPGVFRSLGQ